MTVNLNLETTLEGLGASPGVAFGPAFVIVQRDFEVPAYQVEPDRRREEMTRLDSAILQTRKELQAVQADVERSLGPEEAMIFDAHLLVLEDQALIGETHRELETSGLNIESCFQKIAQKYVCAFENIEDEYLRERATDIRDVTRRVLRHLLGISTESLGKAVAERVVVAHEIAPSDSAALEKGKVLALVAETGGTTSHAVIMARSLRVPAVVGVAGAAQRLKTGDRVIVDGYRGLVIVNPGPRTLERYGAMQAREKEQTHRVLAEAREATRTSDGHRVIQQVNIEGTDDLWKLQQFAHDGVGLFRTEYLFMNSPRIPTEEEQYQVYKEVTEAVGRRPAVIRTLDIGGDKPSEHFRMLFKPEANPFLGFRALRFTLEHPDIFKQQLRAILRASAHGDVRLMFPMVGGLHELQRARRLLEQCREELTARRLAFNPGMPVGIMIEIPSAAVIADLLARECDFFSIGTNDLIQYLLAIDRGNDQISHLYEPLHPAVLRTIRSVCEAAHRHDVPVGVCGEMAGDPLYGPLLAGLGVDELSMAPGPFPALKFLLRRASWEEITQLAAKALELSDPKTVRRLCEQFAESRLGTAPSAE